MIERLTAIGIAIVLGSSCHEGSSAVAPALRCWGNEQREYSARELVESARECRRIDATYQAIDAYSAALRREPSLAEVRVELTEILTSLERHADAASVADGGMILPLPEK